MRNKTHHPTKHHVRNKNMTNRKKAMILIATLIVVAILAGVYSRYRVSINSTINKIIGRPLKGSEVQVTAAESNQIAAGFPKNLILLKDATVVSSKKVINARGLTTYSAVFDTKQDIPSVTKAYTDFFAKDNVNVTDLKVSATDAIFRAATKTSSYLYTAMQKADKSTEFTVQILVSTTQ